MPPRVKKTDKVETSEGGDETKFRWADSKDASEQQEESEASEKKVTKKETAKKTTTRKTTKKTVAKVEEPEKDGSDNDEVEQVQETVVNTTETKTVEPKTVTTTTTSNNFTPKPVNRDTNFDYEEVRKMDSRCIKNLDDITDLVKILIVRGHDSHNPTLWATGNTLLRQLYCVPEPVQPMNPYATNAPPPPFKPKFGGKGNRFNQGGFHRKEKNNDNSK